MLEKLKSILEFFRRCYIYVSLHFRMHVGHHATGVLEESDFGKKSEMKDSDSHERSK